jgi:hypothetical protein
VAAPGFLAGFTIVFGIVALGITDALGGGTPSSVARQLLTGPIDPAGQ